MQPNLRRLWIRITADRKRFGALCALAVGLLLWARLIVVSHPPRTALASEQSILSSTEANSSLVHEISSDPRSLLDARAMMTRRAAVAIQLNPDPNHDPFVISPHHFPSPKPFSDIAHDAGKSRVETAEELAGAAQARLTAQLLALAEKFKLEAALGTSMAVIDGRKFRLGDSMYGKDNTQFEFKLVQIKQRSVVLECEGRIFELQMAVPGT